MENEKVEKFDCREQRNPEKKMAKNVNTRSTSFGAVASTSKESDSVSTSPILDTAKIRRKGNLWKTRRAVSDSAFSPGLAKLTRGQEIHPLSITTEKTQKLGNFSPEKVFEQCKCCDSRLNIDNQCTKCSPDELIRQKGESSDKILGDRLRDLKRLKKPPATISDAQITDEEFVQSVRMLDKVCDLNPPKKQAQTPTNRLGLVPFIQVERLGFSQQNEQRNSTPLIHLSLDEDKEEDGDMFADKDSAEAVEDLEEFTPWKYESPENSPLSFHGFSSQEHKSSREIAEKSSQLPKPPEDDVFFSGFSSEDIKESEEQLENWETKSLKRNRENSKDSRDDEEHILSNFKRKSTRLSSDVGEDPIAEIDGTENGLINNKLKRKRTDENSSKAGDHWKKRNTNVVGLGNEDFKDDSGKENEAREIVTKAEVHSSPRIKYVKEMADFLDPQIKCGFSTAAGRSIKLSQTAIATAKLLLSEEIKSIDDELVDNFELDNLGDSRSKCRILNADEISNHVSKTNIEKSEANSKAKTEIKSDVKTTAFSEIESIEEDLFEELDSVIDSENKSETKAEEKNESKKDQILDRKLHIATDLRISCGFSTAAGVSIDVSKTALEKVETRLAKELENIEDDIFDEVEDVINSGSKSELIEAEEKKESKKDKLLDHKLDIATDSRSSCGFSTAGGIPICVSKTALEKAEALLSQEIEYLEDELFDKLDNTTDSGSKFVLETKISESRTASKEILQSSPKKITESLKNGRKINFGFSTAGGRELKVSDNSWAKSKAVFDKIEEPCNAEIAKTSTNPELTVKKDSKIISGFSTAGGRELKVSENSWAKSKAVFDKIEEPCNAEIAKTSANPELTMKKDSKINSGFSTAGGRELKVSENSWAKSKSVFDKIEEPCNAEIAKTSTNPELTMKKDSKINSGFSTAGGRELKVSENSWSRSKAVFDTIEVPSNSELPETKTEPEFPMKKDSKINFGFSTAGGRELKVSENSWSRSKAVFETIEVPSNTELPETKTEPEFPTKKDSKINFGFSTAGGRELKVSEKSWSKSKAVFETIEVPSNAELPQTKREPQFPMKKDNKINFGFSTAGGRELKVSEKSWSKSKAVFETIEVPSNAELPETRTEPEFLMKNDSKINFGFSTAGGRELKVSENSWAKSKAVFDTFDEPCDAEFEKINTDPEFPMQQDSKIILDFSTPGGRELKASEKAWSKYKAVSNSINDSSNSELTKGNGRSINITKKSVATPGPQLSSDMDNMESLDFDDFVDPVEESETSKKRKSEEIDEDTPLRRESSLKRKRGRYVNDLQARKLFMEDSSREDEVEITKKSSEKNLISEEVDASAAALLEDEERSNEGKTWQINALGSAGSSSPELGCEKVNRSRADVSTNNSFGIFNRAELEKVNALVDMEKLKKTSCSRSASSGSRAEPEEDNDRAASAEKREEIQHESIPDDLTFDSQFSQDIQRSPVIDKVIADAMKIMEGRLDMAMQQDEAIRGKRRTKIEQKDGFLFRLRSDNKEARTSWSELTEGIAPTLREIGGKSEEREAASISADSAIFYSFRCADFYGEMDVRRNIEGIKVGDGAFLVLDEKNCAGVREFERAFLASPGVDPNLVPTGWVKNHYRWIVWKLASMDRVKFGHKCLPRMLTPERVMLELKYRYDREIYRCQWPPLRRILERGEDASARLVLCVSSIIKEDCVNAPVKGALTPNLMGSTIYKMKVTDGWYNISTSIDAAMMNFIKSGKVREGTKLMIFGAQAVNLDQGCSVLEIPEAVTLRIYSNSTRRAKWNTKLDFYRANRGPMSLSLKSVKPNGGAICKLVVAVSRVYPILYREKLSDGQFVLRNARCEEEAARAHTALYQAKKEEIYANAWSEFEIGSMKKKGIGALKNRSYTQEEAAACGRDMEEELREKISERMSECLPTPRDVTPVIKMRIAENDTRALVTVWSTDRDTTELFVEGSSIAIYNAFASGLRSSELQITAGRSTFVKREISRRISYPERIYTSLSDVTESGFNPVYGEFDTIGIVSSTGPAPHGMKNFETVNLACPKPGDDDTSDFLSVLFWQGVSAYGYAQILTVGSLVACSNLEWRKNTSRSIPTAYCTERSVFSKNPRQNHLVQAFESLRNEIKEPPAYAAACAVVIQEEIAKKSALRTPGNQGTPYRPSTSNSRTPGWSPQDLPMDATCTTPRIDSRKISTRKRLEKLEVYGEPPKLPSIVINSSRKVSSDFRSPVRTPVTKS